MAFSFAEKSFNSLMKFKIALLGAGNVAWNLAPALEDAGHEVTEVYARDGKQALEITERLGAAAAKGQQAGLPRGEGQPKPELERSIERVRPFEIGI